MARIKKCLDAGCTKYLFTDDGNVIVSPKATSAACKISDRSAKEYLENYPKMIRNVKETIYTTRELKLKEGDEVPF